MSEFIDFEAVVDNNNTNIVIEVSDDEGNIDTQIQDPIPLDPEAEVSDDSFIDDDADDNIDDSSFYRTLENVRNTDKILAEQLEESYRDFDNISNFCDSEDELEPEVDFTDKVKRIENFEDTFIVKDREQSLVEAILFDIRYILENKFDNCDIDDLKKAIGDFFEQLNSVQYNIELDANKFAKNCMDINENLI